jgi:NAD(P)-dependent dehydrogenase (short-subunit alcohol dehydrogenase family)
MTAAMRGLRDKVAIVTGSTSGIGAATARRLAEEGALVVVTGRNADRADKVVSGIREGGGTAHFIRADLEQEEEVQRLIAETVAEFGSLQIIVNNAAPTDLLFKGIGHDSILDATTQDVVDLFKSGVYGLFWCCKYAIPEMRKSENGAIVNITTVAAFRGHPTTPIYAMMKGAVNSLTMQLAVDFGPNIRVNGVVVGVTTGTPNADHNLAANGKVAAAQRAASLTRLGHANDIAAAAAFLASEDSGVTTGSFVFAEGGVSVRVPLPELGKLRRHGID